MKSANVRKSGGTRPTSSEAPGLATKNENPEANPGLIQSIQALSATASPGQMARREPDTAAKSPAGSSLRASHSPHPVFWMHAVGMASVKSVVAEPGASAKAVLAEVCSRARRLSTHGETSSIDLRFLKSMPEELAILADLLGHGEVAAVVESTGRSEIQETGIPCTWWVRHLNSDNETVGEFIEVADVPDLLLGDRAAIATALEVVNALAVVSSTPPFSIVRQPS